MNKGGSAKGPLSGRHAVVTGGTRGIGAAIARGLAGHGADVTIMARDRAQLERMVGDLRKEFHGKFCAIGADVTDAVDVRRGFAACREQLGEVDILINNAGTVESGRFVELALEDWQRMIDVNLTSVFLCSREVVGTMLDRGDGRIVNIASTAGIEGYPYVTAYTAAKHGVVGLTRALALETAGKGVTVNAVCPGFADTELLAETARKVAKRTGQPVEAIRAHYAASNRSGRLVSPTEVAAKAVWLCLLEQIAVTGRMFVIDGGDEA
jgi:NAD(P)-dependent dehydrogenase (short-subunit alcohol dehydrogenase family)